MIMFVVLLQMGILVILYGYIFIIALPKQPFTTFQKPAAIPPIF
jgi:nitrate reductase gamma subunit